MCVYIFVCVCRHTHCIFFIHSSFGGHVDCFWFLAIVNSAAMNIGVHVSIEMIFFLIYIQEWNSWVIW